MKRLLALMSFFVAFLVGCEVRLDSIASSNGKSEAQSMIDENIAPQSLIDSFERRDYDGVFKVINTAKKMRHQEYFAGVVKSFWYCASIEEGGGCSAEVNSFSQEPRVRLELADYLIQAARNKFLDDEGGDYVEYARSMVGYGDPEISSKAVRIIGIYSDPIDIPLFERILSKEDVFDFYSAAFALSKNCGAKEADVMMLAGSLTDRGLADYLIKSWLDWVDIRKVDCRELLK